MQTVNLHQFFVLKKNRTYLLRFSFWPFPLLLRWVCVANKEEGTEGPVRGVDVEDQGGVGLGVTGQVPQVCGGSVPVLVTN